MARSLQALGEGFRCLNQSASCVRAAMNIYSVSLGLMLLDG